MAININILLILWIITSVLFVSKSNVYNIALTIILGYLIFILKVLYYV